MQGWGVLIIMIGLMCVHLRVFGPSHCQTADHESIIVDPQNFVSTMEQAVAAVATKAQENYSEQCALAQNCTSSRTECHPRKNAKDSPGLKCVYMNNNTACSTETNSSCNKVRADFGEGYVRVPRDPAVIDPDVRRTVCAQKNLDSTFIAVHDNITRAFNLSTFYNIYFGAVDGSFRFFPGREVSPSNCSKYDPRTRPWWRGATSIVKDVVVLLDTGSLMRQAYENAADSTADESPLGLAISMTDSILKTLTANDRATIIPFIANESADAPTLPISKVQTWTVPSNTLWPSESDTEDIKEFLKSVDQGRASNAPNFRAGFLMAPSIFNTSDSTNQRLKIVILITEERTLPSAQDNQIALELQKQGIRLFVYQIYQIEVADASSTTWASVCCAVKGYNQKLYKNDVRTDPMSSLTSYFTFLARSRIAANNGKPYWQRGYAAASGLGNVVTVTHLVMSTDKPQLIGVVGIDVQTAGIVNQTFEPLTDNLAKTNSMIVPVYPNGTDFPNCNFSGNVYGDPNLSACTAPNDTHALCIKPDECEPFLTNATYISLLCCDDCTNIRTWWDKHKTLILSISIPAGTVTVLLLSMFSIKKVGSWPWRPSQEVNRPLPTNLYSFQKLCEVTNDFDDANIITGDASGVLYRARLTDENLVAIKRLGQSADATHDSNSQAGMQTLGIDGHPCRVKLTGTGSGPANRENLNGNNFGPTDRFLAYTLVEGGDGHGQSEAHISNSQSQNPRRSIRRVHLL